MPTTILQNKVGKVQIQLIFIFPNLNNIDLTIIYSRSEEVRNCYIIPANLKWIVLDGATLTAWFVFAVDYVYCQSPANLIHGHQEDGQQLMIFCEC